FVRPAFNLFTMLAETAGIGDLKTPGGAGLTGATALCDLVARTRRSAPPPGKHLRHERHNAEEISGAQSALK
ncbi:hypothetical protein ACKLKD_12385, partial [Klebsiella sp. 10982]|uniref:hypothetical protein n=1 Tax=Klebsiella sp. 10982 TaxID=1196034 RepID=UPI003B28B348